MQYCPGSFVGFFDDTLEPGTTTAGGVVLGPISSVAAAYANQQFDMMLMGIGYKHLRWRQQMFEELSASGIPFGSFVHPAAIINLNVQLGAGCVILAGCILDINVLIGENVFMYPGCIIAHDSKLLGHSFLAPACRLAGEVTVAERCFLGIGTTIIDNLQIGPDVRTGGGAVVVRNLPEPGTYAGVPARRLPPKEIVE
jgi:sugar O-acyltransferase (sialic acid O-acetyltransferase NeuD family)